MNQLKQLLANDTTSNKPKQLIKGGKPTLKGLKWNRKQIVEGNTTYYMDDNYYVNSTGRQIKKIYDKRSNIKVETKKSKARINDGSLLVSPTVDFKRSYTEKTPELAQYHYLHSILTKYKKLRGTLRLILVSDPLSNPETLAKLNDDDDETALVYKYKNIISDFTFEYNGENQEDFKNNYPLILYHSSDYPNLIKKVLSLDINCRLFITKSVEISQKVVSQTFRENESKDCLLRPIYNYYQGKYTDSKTVYDKKRYITMLNKFTDRIYKDGSPPKLGLLSKYSNGVPEGCLSDVVETLQCEIKIDKPLCDIPFMYEKPSKKSKKRFDFMLTEQNHVERYTSSINKVEIESNKEMNTIVNDLLKEGTYFTFNKGYNEYTKVQTLTTEYNLKSEYRDIVNEWEEDINISYIKLDAIKYPDVQEFINNSIHFNTTTDFMELTEFEKDDIHIDMTKAYTCGYKCKYYKGVLGKITDLRPVDNHTQVGYYYITNLCIDNCSNDFKYLNSKLKWFQSNNIYFSAELDMLKDLGGAFVVEFGCYGSSFDLRFNDDMTNLKKVVGSIINDKGEIQELTVPYYSVWTGNSYRIDLKKKVSIMGSQSYMEQLVLPDNASMVYDEEEKFGTISYDKEQCNNLRHVVGGITAYQRIILMEQMLKLDVYKIKRVCVDGIYMSNQDVDMLPMFSRKTKFTLANAPSDTYLSNMDDYTKVPDKLLIPSMEGYISKMKYGNEITPIQIIEVVDDATSFNIFLLPDMIERLTNIYNPLPYYQTELVLGAGGCGKSYREFNKQHIKLLYVAPSNNLSAVVFTNWSDKVQVECSNWCRFLEQPYCIDLIKNSNTVVCDECSMMTNAVKERMMDICKINGIKLIMMGDIGYQLEPILNKNPQFIGATREETLNNKKAWSDIKTYLKETTGRLIGDISHNEFLNEWIKRGYDTYTDTEFECIGFDKITTLTEDRRASGCETLKMVKLHLRRLIDTKQSPKAIVKLSMNYLHKYISTITDKELIEIYKPTDFILTSTHILKDTYTEMFKHLEKYRIINNTRHSQNGQIVYTPPNEESVKYIRQHAFTIHSIQGTTIDKGNNLYINPTNMFSSRSLYTAISRARNIDQIKFLEIV